MESDEEQDEFEYQETERERIIAAKRREMIEKRRAMKSQNNQKGTIGELLTQPAKKNETRKKSREIA